MCNNIKNSLKAFEDLLKRKPRLVPFAAKWNNNFLNEGAVYVIWEKDAPVYVGETSGFKSRMSDLRRPVNHAFTKKMKKRFRIPDNEDELLRKRISKNFKVSFEIVHYGRAEIEEYLVLRWRSTVINKPARRLLNGRQYNWVKPDV